jgi:hypothetical protein
MTTDLTARDEASEEAVPRRAPESVPNAQTRRARTRARSGASRLTESGRELARHWWHLARATWDGLWENSITEQHPASIAALRGYVHSAAWVPGDVPVLELLGRIYGYTVALPVSAVLYALAWLLQRPGRAVLTAIVVVIVWFTAT